MSLSNSIFFVYEYVRVQADSWAKYCWRGDEVGGGWFGRNGSCNTGTAADVPWHFRNGWLGLLMPGGPIKIFIREVKKTKLTWRENEMSQHVKAKYISNLPKFVKVDQAEVSLKNIDGIGVGVPTVVKRSGGILASQKESKFDILAPRKLTKGDYLNKMLLMILGKLNYYLTVSITRNIGVI